MAHKGLHTKLNKKEVNKCILAKAIGAEVYKTMTIVSFMIANMVHIIFQNPHKSQEEFNTDQILICYFLFGEF